MGWVCFTRTGEDPKITGPLLARTDKIDHITVGVSGHVQLAMVNGLTEAVHESLELVLNAIKYPYAEAVTAYVTWQKAQN